MAEQQQGRTEKGTFMMVADEPLNYRVSVRLPESLGKRLEAYMQESAETKSAVIARWIGQGLEAEA